MKHTARNAQPAPIDAERLARIFVDLCECESPSRREAKVAGLIAKIFRDLGADEIIEDRSQERTGSDTGNLLVRFQGALQAPPLFFTCHMDTVSPAEGVMVRSQGDIFKSDGDTVLGGDDKSGIAACVEAVRALKAAGVPHRPVEFVFTVCEEVGLLGAKAFDTGLLSAREGYALDGAGTGELIVRAPALNQLKVRVSGLAAHAGLHPEWGVNAIMLAAQALSNMPCGRIDDESTVNFGLIRGGTAGNIVPDTVTIEGEVRSHSPQKLAQLTQAITDRFVNTARHWTDPSGEARGKPRIEVKVEEDFPIMALAEDSPVVRRLDAAAADLGLRFAHKAGGGGSDANIFNGRGLSVAVVATGMTNIHATNEQIRLEDMADLARLIAALLTQTDS